ncbi:MAG: cation transporter, partial [Syntrophobacteraceae bacterium]
MNTEFACHLCGLPAGGSNISMPVAGQTVSFCCPGCMYVFQILFNSPEGFPEDHKNTELYKACVSAGLIPSETGEGGIYRENSNPGEVKFPLPMSVVSSHADTESDSMADIREGLSRELSLRIEGMWCVACSWLIEQLLRKMDGVLSAGIFFFSDIARIKYLPHVVRPQQIIDSITRLGYRALPVEKGPESSESRDLMVRLGVSAILCMNIMMIS